jgi:uncharacterized ferredoxin-like protein
MAIKEQIEDATLLATKAEILRRNAELCKSIILIGNNLSSSIYKEAGVCLLDSLEKLKELQKSI